MYNLKWVGTASINIKVKLLNHSPNRTKYKTKSEGKFWRRSRYSKPKEFAPPINGASAQGQGPIQHIFIDFATKGESDRHSSHAASRIREHPTRAKTQPLRH